MENFTSNILFSLKIEIGLRAIVFGPTDNQSDRAKAFSFVFKHLVKLLSFVRNDSKPAYCSSGTAMLYQNARAVPPLRRRAPLRFNSSNTAGSDRVPINVIPIKFGQPSAALDAGLDPRCFDRNFGDLIV
jgi:hypothetical protein